MRLEDRLINLWLSAFNPRLASHNKLFVQCCHGEEMVSSAISRKARKQNFSASEIAVLTERVEENLIKRGCFTIKARDTSVMTLETVDLSTPKVSPITCRKLPLAWRWCYTSRFLTPIFNPCYTRQLLTQLCCSNGMLHETIFNATLLATLEPRLLLDKYGGQWVKKTAAENHSGSVF